MKLTTKEAIERRRSIRRFMPDAVPDEHLAAILDAARLAPSGCNAQPWRFRIVKDGDTKSKLARAAFDQSFVAKAPVVIVCCADIQGYLSGTLSGIHDLGKIGAVEDRIVTILNKRAEQMDLQMKVVSKDQLGARISFNVAIAVEHMVLRALDFGLGSCWVRLLDEQMVRDIFAWDENIFVVALLPLGYPAESPAPRKRLEIRDILI
ncbi:MAG TPA: nitroreductase family protein [Thermodesulfovibrionales bacterium]|nr:nitroreductase family protein [Thermodesulfovibrionales bacterium]